MKTKKELEDLKQEYEVLVSKLKELSEDELKLIIGGTQECDNFLADSFKMRTGGDIYIG